MVTSVLSLKDQEASWRQHVKDNGTNELLIANCLTAAGFLTYSGAVNVDTRYAVFYFQIVHLGQTLFCFETEYPSA